jgi:hypothetical protein
LAGLLYKPSESRGEWDLKKMPINKVKRWKNIVIEEKVKSKSKESGQTKNR